MQRISRPLRASQSSLRHSCRQFRGIPSFETSFRPALATFSTGSPRSFLLSGKQDKKKHQQFVRRWQKRLLGDSEPIGAHVDPYDPTSPVRIAPEEQGDYEEVLDDDTSDKGRPGPSSDIPIHLKKGRLHVGGEQWQQEKHQMDLAREFEKLTLRTYTPLSLDMANDIEKLTGTWYTLKDENLLLAQTIHNTTGRPYTTYNFGLRRKMTDPQGLRRCFAQAIAEVYTLNQVGLGMDLSKFDNCGIYEQPSWIRDVKLVLDKKGEPVLAFPKGKGADQLLQAMRAAPAWRSIQATEEETVAIEESMPLFEPIQDPEFPTVDPSSPNLKRAALVKTDTDKKPFDFMSNRPVSRSKPTDKLETTNVLQDQASGASRVSAPSSLFPSLAELNATAESSRVAIIQMRHDVLNYQAQRLIDDVRAWGQNVKQTSTLSTVEDVKWHQIPLTSISIKFAASILTSFPVRPCTDNLPAF